MKFGQMISILPDEDILPPGWKDELQRLQNSATPQSWEDVEPILRNEVPDYQEKFSTIDPTALHSASIGQVHKAALADGTPVALKIRYPNVEDSVESDLELMRKFLSIMQVFPNESKIDDLLATVREGFLQELDFSSERAYYDFYHEHFHDDRGIQIPKAVDGCCSERILTTHWIEGVSIERWIEDNVVAGKASTSALVDDLGYRFQKFFLKELFELHVVQTDPNPANFLVLKNGDLAVLDFGSAQKLSQSVVRAYGDLVRFSLVRNYRGVEQAGAALGFLNSSDSVAARSAFLKVVDIISETYAGEFYSWKNCKIAKRVHDETVRFTTSTRFRPPPSSVVFLNRRILGNQLIMEKLGARLPFRGLVQEYLDLPN
jgi:predicted unusual protein kinase regulating ubiquinone biosynthesis (AarF/ABC1/UbiB family)